jgi:hypothetical protein
MQARQTNIYCILKKSKFFNFFKNIGEDDGGGEGQERSYSGSNGSTEPGPGARVGPARDRQFFSYPYILPSSSYVFSYPYISLSLRLLQMHVPINMLT